jgi:hypothetical protein
MYECALVESDVFLDIVSTHQTPVGPYGPRSISCTYVLFSSSTTPRSSTIAALAGAAPDISLSVLRANKKTCYKKPNATMK